MLINERKIDQTNWPRKELFTFFSADQESQLYEITNQIDVTNLYQFVKREDISFYYALIQLSTTALNRIENFRYRIRRADVYCLAQLTPSFTTLQPGSELFQITTVDYVTDVIQFAQQAKLISNHQTTMMAFGDYQPDQLVQFSCLPWLHYSSFNMERSPDLADSVPKITWGKYESVAQRLRLPYTIQVNHRLVDGYHLGLFFTELQTLIDQLPN